MKSFSYFSFFVLLFATLVSANQLNAEEIVKLYETVSYKNLISAGKSANANDWASFTKKHGNWDITIDKATGTPAMAYGKPIKIIDSKDLSSNTSIESAVKYFLDNNYSIFKVNTSQIKLNRVDNVNGKYYISFSQYHDDLHVLFSEIQFVINSRGEIFNFNVTFYNNIQFPKTEMISSDKAVSLVNQSLNMPKLKINTDKLLSKTDEKQVIIPIYKGNKIDYHLAYQVDTKNTDGMNLFDTYIDAFSGKVLWQKSSMIFSQNIKAKVQTYDRYNFEPVKDFNLSYGYLSINQTPIELNASGEAAITNNAVNAKFTYKTKYTQISFTDDDNQDIAINPVNFSLQNGDNILKLDSTNADKYALFGIHHINVCREKILEVDPNLNCIEVNLPITFYEGSVLYYDMGINAFWSPNDKSFGFTYYKNKSAFLSTCPAVMYHEYGHAINDLFYSSRGTDFINSSCNEGIADINANFILDDPIGTENIYVDKNKEYIRNSDNVNIYPDSISGESHNDGLILAGAFWDLRKLVGVKTAYKLCHFARYSLPDDGDTKLAFLDWFLAVLAADDNNGDLTDGTPHFTEIVTAFNLHNIGTNLMIAQNIDFTPPKDLPSCQSNQSFELKFKQLAFQVSLPDTIFLVYTNDYYKTEHRQALLNNAGTYHCQIPAAGSPQTIRYYFEFADNVSHKISQFARNPNGRYDFVYHTGYYSIVKDDFENSDYSIYSNIEEGNGFEIADPDGNMYYSGIIEQPEDDISEFGTKCLVTGAENDDRYEGCVISGLTEATSPKYQIPNYGGNLYLNFWLFERNLFFDMPIKDPTVGFFVLYKTNKMNDWDSLFTSTKGYKTYKDSAYYANIKYYWKNLFFNLPNSVNTADNIQFKFKVNSKSDYGNSSGTAEINILIDEVELMTDVNFLDVPNVTKTSLSISNSPNPFTNNTNIVINSDKDCSASLYLTDINSNIIGEINQLPISYGINTIPLNKLSKNKLADAVYFIKLVCGDNVYTHKIIKAE